MKNRISILAAVVTMALPWTGLAGGPLALCYSGVPMTWPDGGRNISFNPDRGDLGPLSHSDAVAFVQSAFDVWAAVPTATVSYVNGGELPFDVTVDNFAPFLAPSAPDGLSAIVFDHTGDIFELLFGVGSGILGFAGPEWFDPVNCSILEGVCFLNGPAFTDTKAAFDVMVHEFGHFTGLDHSVVNGQIYIGDTTGPSPENSFGPAPDPLAGDIVETMYPFYFGPGVSFSTLEKDDIAGVSSLYPEPSFKSNYGTIRGSILRPNFDPVRGANVIARNPADPFKDAVSILSGALATGEFDPLAGVFELRGLSPGANYVVYVDQIAAGGFSTPPANLLAHEEFFNGANESNDPLTDVPSQFEPVPSTAGTVTSDINIVLNSFAPGENLPVGDDGAVALFLPFSFRICGQTFNDVWVNANGNITFGATETFPRPSQALFLNGPPRIAGLWTDLNPAAGGTVTYRQTPTQLTISWNNVPEYPATGANSFRIVLNATGNLAEVTYGAVSAQSGIAGISGGFSITGGTEPPLKLRSAALRSTRMSLWNAPASFEEFSGNFALAGLTVRYQADVNYNDGWAGSNNSLATAKAIDLPFESVSVPRLTEIEPVGADVDFFKFQGHAGITIHIEVTRGTMDSLLGLFGPDGQLLAVDDDSGSGPLSKIDFLLLETGTYTVAVSAFPDFGFTGDGWTGGRYVLSIAEDHCRSFQSPGPDNWLVNGSFDQGDFSGWTPVDTGVSLSLWAVLDNSGEEFFRFVEPQDGCFLAANSFDGCGPMQSILYQDVTIPSGEPFLTLEWEDRVQWDLLNYAASTQDRIYSVEIVDPASDSVLQTAFTLTAAASTFGDTAWQSHSADLSSFVGQRIRLRFVQSIPECFSGPGQFELDAVRLRSR